MIRLKNKINMLDTVRKNNYKSLHFASPISKHFKKLSKTSYVLHFLFSRTNTWLHVADCSGKTRYFYSAGLLQFYGKQKTFQSQAIFKKFYKILLNDLPFLQFSSIVVHFKNKNSRKKVHWFLQKLRTKFRIIGCQFSNSHSYNGCRRKKLRRKKFRTKQKSKKEDVAERFKAVDCKSIEFSLRRFESCRLHFNLLRSIT